MSLDVAAIRADFPILKRTGRGGSRSQCSTPSEPST